MTRYFCDSCGEEIKKGENYANGGELKGWVRTKYAGHNVIVTLESVRVETNRSDHDGHICVNCVIDAVMYLDRRPRAVPELPDEAAS